MNKIMCKWTVKHWLKNQIYDETEASTTCYHIINYIV